MSWMFVRNPSKRQSTRLREFNSSLPRSSWLGGAGQLLPALSARKEKVMGSNREQQILLARAVSALCNHGLISEAWAVYRVDPSAVDPEISLENFSATVNEHVANLTKELPCGCGPTETCSICF